MMTASRKVGFSLLVLLALASIVGFSLAPAQGGHSETSPYVALPTWQASVGMCGELHYFPSLQSTCFVVNGDETTVNLRINDEFKDRVDGVWQFTIPHDYPDPYTDYIYGSFCDEATLTVPSGADYLTVYFPGYANHSWTSPSVCNPGGSYSRAAAGTVTADFN